MFSFLFLRPYNTPSYFYTPSYILHLLFSFCDVWFITFHKVRFALIIYKNVFVYIYLYIYDIFLDIWILHLQFEWHSLWCPVCVCVFECLCWWVCVGMWSCVYVSRNRFWCGLLPNNTLAASVESPSTLPSLCLFGSLSAPQIITPQYLSFATPYWGVVPDCGIAHWC